MKRQLDKSLNYLYKRLDEIELKERPIHQGEKLSPEEDYQEGKANWYFHESSWYMRELNGYDGYGCDGYR